MDKTVMYVATLIAVSICFITSQISGCTEKRNAEISKLAQMGIRAEGNGDSIKILEMSTKTPEMPRENR